MDGLFTELNAENTQAEVLFVGLGSSIKDMVAGKPALMQSLVCATRSRSLGVKYTSFKRLSLPNRSRPRKKETLVGR